MNDLQERVKVSDFDELQVKLDKIQTKQREDYKLLESQRSQLDRLASKMKDYFQSAEKESLSKEAYSKRFHLLVHGLEEQSDSAWEKRETTENFLRKFLAEGLKIDHPNDISIVNLHRLPRYPLFKNNVTLNRPIIFKLSNDYDKQLIMSRLKLVKDYNTTRKNANPTASKIFISDHLPKALYEQKKRFLPLHKKARSEGKKATWLVQNGEYCLYVDGKRLVADN